MARLNFLLLLSVLASALYLVHAQYQSRQLITALDRAHAEARRLELDSERLQVDKRAQATPLRVETLAKEQLKMRTTTPAVTLYVRPDGAVIPAVASPAAATTTAPTSGSSRRPPAHRTKP